VKDRLRTAVRLLLEIAVIVAIAAAIPAVLARVLGTRHPLATITSQSMWPALKRGDIVLIRGPRHDGVRPGMIVVYQDAQGSGMIIHRVVKIVGSEIVTKGDANDGEDEPVAESDVAGVVAAIRGHPVRVPYLGYVALLVRRAPR
jgi:signal peptidase I